MIAAVWWNWSWRILPLLGIRLRLQLGRNLQ
jgi:hypothetical protein